MRQKSAVIIKHDRIPTDIKDVGSNLEHSNINRVDAGLHPTLN
jgi:hypothetical protein